VVAGGRESTATSGGWPVVEHVASDGADGAPDDSQTTAGISDRASTWPTTTAAAPTVRIHATTNPSTSSVRALSIKKSVQRGRGRGRTVEGALDASCVASRAGGRISRVNVGRTRSREVAPSEKGAGPGTGDGPGRLKNGWAGEGAVIGTTSFGSGRGKDRSRDVSRSPSTSGSCGGTGMRDRTGARDGEGVRSALDARDGTGVRSALDARGAPVRNALDARDGTGVRNTEEERVERGSGGGVVRAARRGDDPLSPSARSALARLTT
jgi:hypothetical protein